MSHLEVLFPSELSPNQAVFRIPDAHAIVPETECLCNVGLYDPEVSGGVYLTPYNGVGRTLVQARYQQNDQDVWLNRYPAQWTSLSMLRCDNPTSEDLRRTESLTGTGYGIYSDLQRIIGPGSLSQPGCMTLTSATKDYATYSVIEDASLYTFTTAAFLDSGPQLNSFNMPTIASTGNRVAPTGNQSGQIYLADLAPYYTQIGRIAPGAPGIDPPAPNRVLTIDFRTDEDAVFLDPAGLTGGYTPNLSIVPPYLTYQRYPNELAAELVKLAYNSVYQDIQVATMNIDGVVGVGTVQNVNATITAWNGQYLDYIIFYNDTNRNRGPFLAHSYAQAMYQQVIQVYVDNGTVITHQNGINDPALGLKHLHEVHGTVNFPLACAQSQILDTSYFVFDANTVPAISTAGVTALRVERPIGENVQVVYQRTYNTHDSLQNQPMTLLMFGLVRKQIASQQGRPVSYTQLTQ